jgi:hypothetical protein
MQPGPLCHGDPVMGDFTKFVVGKGERTVCRHLQDPPDTELLQSSFRLLARRARQRQQEIVAELLPQHGCPREELLARSVEPIEPTPDQADQRFRQRQ